MTIRMSPRWRVAVAAHGARELIGQPASDEPVWRGMADFLHWAGAAGFSGIDLSDTVVPFDRRTTGLPELARAATDHGLQFASLNLFRSSLADPDHGAANVERVRRTIEAAAVLGAGVVSISLALPRAVDDCNLYRGLDHSRGSSRQATERDVELTASRLRDLGAQARDAGITLSIELHHASLADNGVAAARLHHLVGHSGVGINPDLVNAYWAYCTPEEDWRDQLAMLAPLANLWHVKNVKRIEVEPGRRATYLNAALHEGDIDYRWACSTMQAAGFSGWVSIERGGPGDFLADARRGLDYLIGDLNAATFGGRPQCDSRTRWLS